MSVFGGGWSISSMLKCKRKERRGLRKQKRGHSGRESYIFVCVEFYGSSHNERRRASTKASATCSSLYEWRPIEVSDSPYKHLLTFSRKTLLWSLCLVDFCVLFNCIRLKMSSANKLTVVCLMMVMITTLLVIQSVDIVAGDFEMYCMNKCATKRNCKKYGAVFADTKCESSCKRKCYKVS